MPVEEQVGRARLLRRRRRGAGRLADLDQRRAPAASRPARPPRRPARRGRSRGRARRRAGSSRLAAASSSGAERRCPGGGEGDLRRAAARRGARWSSSSGPASAPRQQRQRRVGRAGLVLGLRRGQRPPRAARRVGGQRGGAAPGTRPRPPARRAPRARSPSAPARRRRPRRARRAACARCHARRSGSARGSVASASARCARCRSSGDRAPGRSPSGPAGWRKRPARRTRAARRLGAGAAASAPIPSRSAARHSSVGSPIGSAAATSGSRCGRGRERARARRRKLSSIRPGQRQRGRQPEAAGELARASTPRGSSSSASGLPRVSATIRSRTRVVERARDRPRRAARGRRRRGRPCDVELRQPGEVRRRPARGRRTRARPTPPSSRRATKASACAEARSSHCASSIDAQQRLLLGRPRTAGRARRGRPGSGPAAPPALSPNAVASASRWGSGSVLEPSSSGAHSWCSAANGSSISRLRRPPLRATRMPRARAGGVVQQRGLADPRLASHDQRPALTRAHRLEHAVDGRALPGPVPERDRGDHRRTEPTGPPGPRERRSPGAPVG